jgi:hypothetical protein
VARAFVAVAVAFTLTCLLFVALNLGVAAWLAYRESRGTEVLEDFVVRSLEHAYPDLSPEDRAEILRHARTTFVFEAIAQPREEPMTSRFVNVDPAGFRHGADQGPWPPSRERFNVFLFGGSTTFGYGLRDEDTVGSRLQAALGTVEGKKVAVYNFGRGGAYSTQERLLFERLLTLGYWPDLAIFLDGLNDFAFITEPPQVAQAVTQAVEDDIESPILAVLRGLPLLRLFSDFRRIHEPIVSGPGPREAQRDPSVYERVIRRYIANQAAIAAIGRVYGVATVFVWQPVPTYHYDLRHHLAPRDFAKGMLVGEGYRRMRRHLAAHPLDESFVWCADVQAGFREPLYVDRVHYAPRLAQLVTDCIASGLRASRLAPESSSPSGPDRPPG